MAKKVQLWIRGDERGVVVYPDEIKLVYPMYDARCVKFSGIAPEEVENLIPELNRALKEETQIPSEEVNEEFLQEFVQKFFFERGKDEETAERLSEFEYCSDVEDVPENSVLAFNFYIYEFYDLKGYYEEETVYQYWDGHNWKEIWGSECSITELEISENKVILDEWDGRNMVTGGPGEHQYVYKVYKEDGEDIEDSYLVVYSSQWQGVLDTAKVMTEDGLRRHLEEIDRDVEEYIALCKKIES